MKKLITALSLVLASQAAMAAQECSTDFGKTAPNSRYTYSDVGTVTDLKTGLTWMRCLLAQRGMRQMKHVMALRLRCHGS